jgi:Family of unknown function (DUF6364)
MAKVTKNLSLDEAAVQRGEQYSALHDTSLSRLVSDFLIQLPVDEPARPLPPVVRRLIGIGISEALPNDEGRAPHVYRNYLDSKYGSS